MNIFKSLAVVLKSENWRETSKILTLFSQRFGKIKVIAKGARDPKSRLAGNLELFSQISIVFYKKENTDLHLLSQVDLMQPLPKIQNDLKRFSYASAVAELLNKLTESEEVHPGLFSLSWETLQNLEDAPVDKLDNYLWSYALKLASALGYRPKLQACIECNKKESLSGEQLFFSPEQGGMICKNCVQEGSFYLKLSKKSWEALKLLLTSQNSHLEALALNKKQISEISDTVLSLLEYHTHLPRTIKSLEFWEKLVEK